MEALRKARESGKRDYQVRFLPSLVLAAFLADHLDTLPFSSRSKRQYTTRLKKTCTAQSCVGG